MFKKGKVLAALVLITIMISGVFLAGLPGDERVRVAEAAGDFGSITNNDWVSMGSLPGMNSAVNALLLDEGVDGDTLYAGGQFASAADAEANRVARWDETTGEWSALGDGLDTNVRSLAMNGDGTLYAGGSFSGGIAEWNEGNEEWTTVGDGVMPNEHGHIAVQAIASGDNKLYVGGGFNKVGGSEGIDVSNIAMWDSEADEGTGAWSAMGGGVDEQVNAMVLDEENNLLYVGGWFTNAGGETANRVAVWDINAGTWSALGDGENNGVGGTVLSLELDSENDLLYVGGIFTVAGGETANRIAVWNINAGTWSSLGDGDNNGVNQYVAALALDSENDLLYLGGNFTEAGGETANRIAVWNINAGTWSSLGGGDNNGMDSIVFSLVLNSDGSTLYAGGMFQNAGNTAAARVARWDTAEDKWHALVSESALGLNNHTFAMESDGNGTLYAGGSFTNAFGITVNRVAAWDTDGEEWSALGGGLDDGRVWSLALDRNNDLLYAGGTFNNVGGEPANRVAVWDIAEETWSALGDGLSGTVRALAVDSKGNLYAGIDYGVGSGECYIAMWDGESWHDLGSGVNNNVYALAVDSNDNLYVGGEFTQSGGRDRVAMWDGEHWHDLSGGVSHRVEALAVDSTDKLYVGGLFTEAGGEPANYVAKWDGENWHALGDGTNADVYTLSAYGDGNIYAGGAFAQAGGKTVNYIARWDGAEWQALGSGANEVVRDIAVFNPGYLFAGGSFMQAGGKSSAYIARCNLPTDNIDLTINPEEALTAGGKWSIDGGGTWFESGAQELLTGTYTVTFKEIEGWRALDIEDVALYENETFNLNANYRRILTLDSLTVDEKTYDGNTVAVVSDFGTLEGIHGADVVGLDITGAEASFDSKDAGTDKTVTVTGLDLTGENADGYIIFDHTVTADITRKELTLDGLEVANKIYDGDSGATVTAYGTLEGIISPDVVELDTDAAEASFDSKDAGIDKTVTVTGLVLEGADDANYVIYDQTATADINPVPLTITADDKSKIYGEDDPAFTVSYAGFVSGEDEGVLDGALVITREVGEGAGDYIITPSGLTSANYEIIFVPSVLTITHDFNYGDVSGSGAVTVNDAILILRHIVGLTDLTDTEDYDEGAFIRARVGGEESLGVSDAILILRFIVGLINDFPVEAVDVLVIMM